MKPVPKTLLRGIALTTLVLGSIALASAQEPVPPLVKQMYDGQWPDKAEIEKLTKELIYQRAVAAYMMTLPALNVIGLREYEYEYGVRPDILVFGRKPLRGHAHHAFTIKALSIARFSGELVTQPRYRSLLRRAFTKDCLGHTPWGRLFCLLHNFNTGPSHFLHIGHLYLYRMSNVPILQQLERRMLLTGSADKRAGQRAAFTE